MEKIIDKYTGESWIQLNKEEIKIGFLVQCIEKAAEAEGCEYTSMFNRLERADMTQGYILRFYDTLHTESFENIISSILTLLHQRESI